MQIEIEDVQKQLGQAFQVERQIGKGSFGALFQLKEKETQLSCAVKVERADVRNPKLGTENKFYQQLYTDRVVGIP